MLFLDRIFKFSYFLVIYSCFDTKHFLLLSYPFQLNQTTNHGEGTPWTWHCRFAGLPFTGRLSKWKSIHWQPPETISCKSNLRKALKSYFKFLLLIINQTFFIFFLQTYIGQVLVSINPYKELDIYSEQNIQEYQGKHFFEAPPHM